MRWVVILFGALLVSACQLSENSWAARSCQKQGLEPGDPAYAHCVEAEFARGRAIANRWETGGP
jgi:hypothetical protein